MHTHIKLINTFMGGSRNLRKGAVPPVSFLSSFSLPFPFPLISSPLDVGPFKPARGSGGAL